MAKLIDRTGEINRATNGQLMEIIEYINSSNITVKFEDNTIVKEKSYASFKSGSIANPNYNLAEQRIGETNKAYNGKTMKIVEYTDCNNIVVEFEDKTRVPTSYKQFEEGCVRLQGTKGYTKRFRESREKWLYKETETIYGKCKIVDYKGYNGITVEFEDGTIVETDMRSFINKSIKNPNIKKDSKLIKNTSERLGQETITKEGYKVKIVKYNSAKDITVEFEDKTQLNKVNYSQFVKGDLKKPVDFSERIGLVKTMNNGLKAKIIEYNDCDNITVQFENNKVRKNISYGNFIKGTVDLDKRERLGQTSKFNNGLIGKIIEYNSSTDITVKFEDKTVVKHTTYSQFKRGQLKHPTISVQGTGKLGNFKLIKKSYRAKNEVFYECECMRCGLNSILTPQEILKHRC